MVENISGRPYAFSMVPCRGQMAYFLEAFSQKQRVGQVERSDDQDLWVHVFIVIQLLLQKLCVKKLSKRMNSIHEVISLQDTLGRGKYGVVRLGQVIVVIAMVIHRRSLERCAQ